MKKSAFGRNTEAEIRRVCRDAEKMLIAKNRKYGDSALDPVRIFSKSDADEGIRVRLDDKLSRIKSGRADDDEDVVWDLLGYLVLWLVHRDRK